MTSEELVERLRELDAQLHALAVAVENLVLDAELERAARMDADEPAHLHVGRAGRGAE